MIKSRSSSNEGKKGASKSYFLFYLLFLPFLLILNNKHFGTDNQSKAVVDTLTTPSQTYNIFSTIPDKKENIFKGSKLEAIRRMRESYLINKKDDSGDILFEYEELEEACRQAFGAFAPNRRSLIIRGIMTANGVANTKNAFRHKYRLFTPFALGLEEGEDINTLERYENLPEFNPIVKSGPESFSLDKRIELYKLREYYLDDKPYLTKSIGFDYQELDKLINQAFNTSSPYLQALIKRGILTAHKQYKLTDSTKIIKYRPGTPAEMGFSFGGLINEIER